MSIWTWFFLVLFVYALGVVSGAFLTIRRIKKFIK